MPEQWTKHIAPELVDAQREEYEKEHQSLERQREEAKKLISDLLTHDAQILVMDLSQGVFDPKSVDPELYQRIREDQFGGGVSMGETFRHLLGFDPGDPRVHIWDVPTEDLRGLPYPDAWIATGGPAMPSELDPGNTTVNTLWLRRAVEAMQELSKAHVPGVAVCLGHQLYEYSRGAVVGTRHPQREFGTKTITATDVGKQLQLLYGFWDDQGSVEISASHREAVKTRPPASRSIEVVALNTYSDYQAAAHALKPGQTVLEANAEDSLVLTMQNHPEVLAILLEALRSIRGTAIEQEGIDVKKLFFKNTPRARTIWKNFIELVARRLAKRT